MYDSNSHSQPNPNLLHRYSAKRMAKPINFIYGWHGVLLAMTLHYFPLITLNVVDGLP